MMTTSHRRAASRAALAPLLALSTLALVVDPDVASAQGLSTPTVGIGTSTAVSADPTAVYFNPAMQAFQRGRTHLLLGGTLVVGDIRYQRDYRAVYQQPDSLDFETPIDPSMIDPSKHGYQSTVQTNPVALAPQGFGTFQLGHHSVVGGFGIYSPYAAILDFSPSGPQRFQLQKATIMAVYFTPTIAWRPVDWFSIGAGVSYVLGYAELSRIQDFATLNDVGQALANPPISQPNSFGTSAPPEVRELDVMARPFVMRNGWSNSATFHVGMAFQPTEKMRLGLVYQHSAKMHFDGTFQLDMNDDFFTQDLASQGLQYKPIVSGDATLGFTLPRILRFAASYDLTRKVGVALEVDYTFWSQVDAFVVTARSPDLAQPAVGIPDQTTIRLARNWHDTIGIDGVLRFSPGSGKTTLWGRFGFRQSAVPNSTIDVASPDGNRFVGDLGGSIRLSDDVSLIGDLGIQAITKRTVVSSNYDVANGIYQLFLFTGGLNLRVDLD